MEKDHMRLCSEYTDILDELKGTLGADIQRETAELALLTGDTRKRKLTIARDTLDFSYKLVIYPEYAALQNLIEHVRWLRQALRIYGTLRPVIASFYQTHREHLKAIEAGMRLINED